MDAPPEPARENRIFRFPLSDMLKRRFEINPKPAGDSAPPFTLLAAGPTWMVVEKPSGMSIHNDPGRDLCSRVKAALKDGRIPGVDPHTGDVRAVHRLDRDTSGVVLLAGDAVTAAFFGDQFARRQVGKGYLALVHGRPTAPGEDAQQGEWRWELTASAGGRKDPAGRGRRQACKTRWRILDTSRRYTLLACEPLSGRKHQIRRHARLAGHAVVGDRRYGSPRSVRFLADRCGFDRLGLHAHVLSVRLPGDADRTTFTSGGLPASMRRLLASDR